MCGEFETEHTGSHTWEYPDRETRDRRLRGTTPHRLDRPWARLTLTACQG